MSTDNLNKTLAKLETSLRSIDSARKQVETVSESSKSLTEATTELLKEIKQLSVQFEKGNLENISQLTNSLNDFETKIGLIATKADKVIVEKIKHFKKETSDVISKYFSQITESEQKLSRLNDASHKNIANVVEEFKKSTDTLKKDTEEKTEEIKSIAINEIRDQEKEISKTINYIIETGSKVQNLINTLSGFDLPKSLEDLHQKLDSQVKQSKVIMLLLYIIIGLIGVGGGLAILIKP